MNDLMHSGSGGGTLPTMSTREIAELTSKKHQHVMRDAGAMFKALDMDQEGYVHFWTDPQNGQRYREFLLPKDLTLTLVAGYDIQLRHRIVKRLEEIEARVSDPMVALNDAAALRGFLLTYSEKVIALEHKVEELAPKAEALDLLETSEGSVGPRLAAKMLNMPEKKFTSWLQTNRWAFRQNGIGPLQAYVDKRDRGYLEHRPHTYRDQVRGEDRTIAQMMITPKGLKRLAERLSGGRA
ncbi:hypothetical protein HHL08_14265 [Sphingobium sp. AR-3-1]|uniref:Antirepressor protein C-terminal domain-containing protein n=1 Tax=Sphingobium psychrophilum TaxID=2728834 RepID=A0A7X9WWP5_9SPHN|nr:phage antirepressor KilAC domain-containing protein [Sphingobium psychrophilum]NML11296.1 hypothetical protein [Sphingobium psychrophilum]